MYLDNCAQASKTDIHLARNIYETIPYPFNSGLQGEAFKDLSMITKICRQTLLAEGKSQVCKTLIALLMVTEESTTTLCHPAKATWQQACCQVAHGQEHAILKQKGSGNEMGPKDSLRDLCIADAYIWPQGVQAARHLERSSCL